MLNSNMKIQTITKNFYYLEITNMLFKPKYYYINLKIFTINFAHIDSINIVNNPYLF